MVELESVEKVHPADTQPVQTYLRLTGMKLPYLLDLARPW